MNFNWTCLERDRHRTGCLTQYGCQAERHWRQFRPKMVEQLEALGQLNSMLREAEARTVIELHSLRRTFRQQGLTAEQAEQQAWELVREKYLFLPPEN